MITMEIKDLEFDVVYTFGFERGGTWIEIQSVYLSSGKVRMDVKDALPQKKLDDIEAELLSIVTYEER
jgi:hypothetical protein